MPSNSGKVTVSIRLTPELDDWLLAKAHRTGLSRSELVERGLRLLKAAAGEEDA